MNAKQAAAIATLAQGGVVEEYSERGNSMTPLICSGQKVTLVPVENSDLKRGDVVLAKVRGRLYLHKITAIRGNQVQIGNNHGHINGWTTRRQVFGRAVLDSAKES